MLSILFSAGIATVLFLFGILIEAYKLDFTNIEVSLAEEHDEDFIRMFSDGLRESCRNEAKNRQP